MQVDKANGKWELYDTYVTDLLSGRSVLWGVLFQNA